MHSLLQQTVVHLNNNVEGMRDFISEFEVRLGEDQTIGVRLVFKTYERIDKDLDYNEQHYHDLRDRYCNELLDYLTDVFRYKRLEYGLTGWDVSLSIADGLRESDPPRLVKTYRMYWNPQHEKCQLDCSTWS